MKKLLCTLLLAFVCTGSMFAQKGMNGIGINIPVGVYDGYTYLGIGTKYQYNFSDYFRGEISFEYFPIYSNKYVYGVFDYDHINYKAFLNANIFLMSSRPARPYIIAGAGLSVWGCADVTSSHSLQDDSDECFSFNVGLGYDFRLSYSVSMKMEATAFNDLIGTGTAHSSYVDHDHEGKWSFLGRVGLTYNF